MGFDWKKTLPFIGALVTGNVPALVTAAASAVSDVLGVPVEPTADAVDTAMKAATPEQLLALKQADASLKIRFRELDTEDKKTEAAVTTAYISDVGDARKFNANTHGILILGIGINIASYACIFAVLYGCFWVLGASGKLNIDPGIAAMIGGVIGAAVQWLMSNAAQANGFFFGSSPSSRQASTDLTKAVGDAAKSIK